MKKLIILVVILGLAFAGYKYFSAPIKGDEAGGVNIILIDETGKVVSNVEYDFQTEVNLFTFMNEHYSLSCADSGYKTDDTCSFTMLESHVLLVVDDVESTWTGSFIQIIIDEIPSEYGIDRIMLKDNTTYTFKYVELGGASE